MKRNNPKLAKFGEYRTGLAADRVMNKEGECQSQTFRDSSFIVQYSIFSGKIMMFRIAE